MKMVFGKILKSIQGRERKYFIEGEGWHWATIELKSFSLVLDKNIRKGF